MVGTNTEAIYCWVFIGLSVNAIPSQPVDAVMKLHWYVKANFKDGCVEKLKFFLMLLEENSEEKQSNYNSS